MKQKEIRLSDVLSILSQNGINRKEVGWNPTNRKLGFSKTKPKNGSYDISFHYFDIDENNKIVQCPKGYGVFKNYTIIDFEIAVQTLGK